MTIVHPGSKAGEALIGNEQLLQMLERRWTADGAPVAMSGGWCEGIRPMNILYVSSGVMPDYQCDMVFHGLRALLGPDVVDVERPAYMYAATYADDPAAKGQLYGRGFTLFTRVQVSPPSLDAYTPPDWKPSLPC